MSIMIDDIPLLFPIVIKQSATRKTLEKGLTFPGGIMII
jgi:hypothetical protein